MRRSAYVVVLFLQGITYAGEDNTDVVNQYNQVKVLLYATLGSEVHERFDVIEQDLCVLSTKKQKSKKRERARALLQATLYDLVITYEGGFKKLCAQDSNIQSRTLALAVLSEDIALLTELATQSSSQVHMYACCYLTKIALNCPININREALNSFYSAYLEVLPLMNDDKGLLNGDNHAIPTLVAQLSTAVLMQSFIVHQHMPALHHILDDPCIPTYIKEDGLLFARAIKAPEIIQVFKSKGIQIPKSRPVTCYGYDIAHSPA